jgi:hypothetical protein
VTVDEDIVRRPRFASDEVPAVVNILKDALRERDWSTRGCAVHTGDACSDTPALVGRQQSSLADASVGRHE